MSRETVPRRPDESQIADRTLELTVLLDVSRQLTAIRTLRELAAAMLEQLKRVIDYTGGSAVEFIEGGLRIIESVGPAGRESSIVDMKLDTTPAQVMWDRVQAGQPVVVDDVLGDTPEAKMFRATMGADNMPAPEFNYIRSWMAMPLELENRVVGMLSISKNEPGYFTEHHVELAMAIARHAAVAADNARLFDQRERRTRELATLAEVSRALSSTLELQPLLELILDKIMPLLACNGAGVSLREPGGIRQLAVRRPSGISNDKITAPDRLPDVNDPLWRHAMKGEPLIIPDVLAETEEAKAFRDLWGGDLSQTPVDYVRGLMTIPLVSQGNTIGTLNFASDQPGFFNQGHADLVMTVAGPAAAAIENARLFAQTQARTRELAALFEISQALSSTLELQPLLELMLDKLKPVLNYDGAGVTLREGNIARQVAVRRPDIDVAPEDEKRFVQELDPEDPLWGRVSRGKATIIPDVWNDDTPEAASYRAPWGGDTHGTRVEYVRCFATIPLMVKDEAIGVLNFASTEPGYFNEHHLDLIKTVAGPAAAAIENARLFKEAGRRAREMEALFRSDERIFRSLQLEDVLQAIVDVAVELLGAEKAIVTTWDEGERRLTPRASRNFSSAAIAFMKSSEGRMAPRSRPEKMIVEEEWIDEVEGPWRDQLVAEGISHFAEVALMSPEGEILGSLAASYPKERALTEDDKRTILALAERAVMAIDNAALHARSYTQGQQLAAIEERQRLARELHDSVSQVLYGIALGARTARTVLDRDPAKAAEPVDYVLSLAEAGLAEMRALIFELRPESLEMEGLVAALSKQIAATAARYEIEITADFCDEPDVSIERKEVLYRIAQEALHNTVKHARATAVQISLARADGRFTLSVGDNGVGFDPAADYPGHLGLRSMRERATQAGGGLEIESAAGSGTKVTASVPSS